MIGTLPPLPVSLRPPPTEMMEGVYDRRGVLRLDGDAIALDLRPLITHEQGDLTTYRVSLDDVAEVALVNRWWSPTRLVVRPARLAAIDAIPHTGTDRLTFAVKRADRDLASRWATALSLALLERSE